MTSFEGIGDLTEEEELVSERALVPYALMGQPAMHSRARWAGAGRPGYSAFLVSELQRLLHEGPMVEDAEP